MSDLFHELIQHSAAATPDQVALIYKDNQYSYAELAGVVSRVAGGLAQHGLAVNERVGIYLAKLPESVATFFATSLAGGVFVPINPLSKAAQVAYVLKDCGVRVLVTSKERYSQLKETLGECHDLHTVVLVNCEPAQLPPADELILLSWQHLLAGDNVCNTARRIDADMAAILYTSGSSGKAKGVVLSHRNLVTGAISVTDYLNNTADDRLLALLPFSFDYGLSQLSTAFVKGATVVLMDYLLPKDVLTMVVNQGITGLAGVPSLWNRLAQLEWPEQAVQSLRYLTNSGGALPRATLQCLRDSLPDTQVYLMYGLTEAFRSTYLPPQQIDKRPGSIGKAIPNAEVMVVREDGSPCVPGETGELVHRGALVALGYWNDPAMTAQRFKPAPGQHRALTLPEIAVWSGDSAKMDDEGYLYFVGRKDDMIKTSGYRVSPTEIEEIIYATQLVTEAVALGIPHPNLGQGIVVVATSTNGAELDSETIIKQCKKALPNYMVPLAIKQRDSLARNANGKVDRMLLSKLYQDIFDGC